MGGTLVKPPVPLRHLNLFAFVLCATVGTLPAWANGSGQIAVPARGLLDLTEGTFEAWVKFEFCLLYTSPSPRDS